MVGNYCRESVFHHLIVEFDCDDKCVEDNIKDTASFYQMIDNNQNWLQLMNEKNDKYKGMFEKCSPTEGPLITVNNSENQMIHSVTARRVQGLLQTIILGVLSSPVIKHRVFYLSRVNFPLLNSDQKLSLEFYSMENLNLMFWGVLEVMLTYHLVAENTLKTWQNSLGVQEAPLTRQNPV